MTQAPTSSELPPPGFIGRLSVWVTERFMGGDIRKAREMERFLKFSVVGSIGFVVDFGTFNILLALVQPESGSALILLCSTIAFVVAVINNFLWNRYWTYPDSRSKSITAQLILFTAINAVGLVIRTLIIRVLEPMIHDTLLGTLSDVGEAAAVNLSSSLALAVAVVVVLFWNFFVNRYWTYNDIE